jgi:hypothetical protein
MINYNTLGSNIKRKMLGFTENICKELTRPEFKFISQMIYGMLSAQSCHLSKIARKLDEKTSIKKIIDRLSHNLKEFDGGERLFGNYIRKIKSVISDRTIFIIDNGDITKPCSPKLEGIATVRDGSTGEYGQGYHTLEVTALTPEKKMPVSVYTRVYSAEENGFISEDNEVLKSLNFLSKHFKKNNIRALDRGYDANIYYERLIDKQEKFVIRSKKNRNVDYKGKRINIYELAKRFKGKYCLKFKKKNGVVTDCKISIVPIKLPCRPKAELNLVICNGLGMEPLMLITNLRSNDDRLAVTITKVYLMRWRIEEFYRFKKQQFGFEDFRVQSLKSIRNLNLLLSVAIGFIGMMSEKIDERRIVMEVIYISKRIRGVPKFVFYAIADGLFEIFAKLRQGIADMLLKKPKPLQLSLFPDVGFGIA